MFKNPNQAPKNYTPGEALQKIAAFCAYQERTHREVADKLKSYGLDEDEAGEIIIRLGREKLLDEERYAQAYARGKHRTNGWGRRRIKLEMKAKGLSDYCIKSGLKELEGEEYYAKLKQLLEQRNAREKESHPLKRKMKLMAYLNQKGYESDLIQDALGELLSPED
ncbi:RecX family transcriptional regulator [Hymenobacter sp. HMF4947]|uniref:Regulatory protein RecX n=1 Tax=Hymenobacter ginkgonis TaxID=2682976 RepID=A0A7K1TEK7_9BACT|nr:regulatory protein RecX [Hymenobacter ginkgonis]MVN76837.1 RecX family transcriptional regulator [Hymenobacter ginkgonis]